MVATGGSTVLPCSRRRRTHDTTWLSLSTASLCRWKKDVPWLGLVTWLLGGRVARPFWLILWHGLCVSKPRAKNYAAAIEIRVIHYPYFNTLDKRCNCPYVVKRKLNIAKASDRLSFGSVERQKLLLDSTTVKKVVSQVVTWPATSRVFSPATKGGSGERAWQRKCTRQSNLSYSHSQFPRSTLGTPVTSPKPIFLATKIKRLAFYDWGFPTEARVISSRDSCSENNAELFCKGGLRNVQIFTSHTVTVSLVKEFFGDFLIAVAVVVHWGSSYYFLVR